VRGTAPNPPPVDVSSPATRPAPEPAAATGRTRLTVAGLALLAVLVALGGAIDWHPTLDEAYVYGLSQHGFGAMLAFWAEDPQSLVHYVIAYPFAAVADPIWWLRIPSLVAFALAVVALWWTARQRYGSRVALGAAALLAISPLGASFGADARWPMLAMLLAILSWGTLLRGIDTGRRRWWVAYAVVVVLGMYTNVLIAFVVLAQALPVWWERRRALRPWLVSLGAAAVATAPLAVLVAGASAVNPLFRVPRPAPLEVPGMLGKLLGADGPERVRQLLVVLAVLLVAWAGWRLRDRLGAPGARAGWLALAWFAVPVAVDFVVSQGGDSFWLPRYLIGVVPAACLLLAWSAATVGGRAGLGLVTVIAALMVVAVAHQTVADVDERTGDWTAAAAAARPPGAPVVFFDAEGVQAAGYHSPRFAAADGTPILPGWEETPVPEGIVLLDNPRFDRLRNGPPSPRLVARLARSSPSGVVVLVLRPPDPETPGVAWAREACTVDRQDFGPASVVRVSRCRPGPLPAA
jgi:4-amino-4-deoxy-L-arabinose transferase-like glycosyltransferase